MSMEMPQMNNERESVEENLEQEQLPERTLEEKMERVRLLSEYSQTLGFIESEELKAIRGDYMVWEENAYDMSNSAPYGDDIAARKMLIGLAVQGAAIQYEKIAAEADEARKNELYDVYDYFMNNARAQFEQWSQHHSEIAAFEERFIELYSS